MTANSASEWLTEKQVAPMIGLSYSWLRVARKKHPQRYPVWYRISGRVKYRREDVNNYLEGCRGQ